MMYVNYLEELAQYINLDQLIIPPQVIEYVVFSLYKCHFSHNWNKAIFTYPATLSDTTNSY